MTKLLNAIHTAFTNSTPLMTAFPNGLQVAQGYNAETLPLCVLTPISNVPDYSTVNGSGHVPYFEEAIFQFDVWDRTGDNAVTGLEQIDTVFNYASLSLTTDVCLSARRTGGLMIVKEDEQVFHGYAEYRFRVQRTI